MTDPLGNRRRTSLIGRNLIKSHEKLRLTAYKPTPNDVWTLGWGHTRAVTAGATCTLDEAERMFEMDIFEAERGVDRLISVPLNQNQYDALVSFVFNLGYPALRGSTLRIKLNKGDYEGAAKELDRWVHQNGKKLGGLITRRAEEKALFETPAELSLA